MVPDVKNQPGVSLRAPSGKDEKGGMAMADLEHRALC